MKSERLDYTDVAKGIGIFLVVLGHASLKNAYITSYIYTFHMPLFFVISGLLLHHTGTCEREFRKTVISRLYSIMLPYLIFSIIYTIIDCISHSPYTLTNLRASVCLQGSGPLWFLPTLFLSQLIFIALIKYIGIKAGSAVSAVLSVAALFINLRCIHLTGADFLNVANEYGANISLVVCRVFVCLIFIDAGYLFSMLISRVKLTCPISGIAGLVLMISAFIPDMLSFIAKSEPDIYDMHYLDFGNNIPAYLLCSLSGSFGVILLCRGCEPLFTGGILKYPHRLLKFWGENSLFIMVTHLNCQILFLGNLFAALANTYITRAKDYFFLFNVLWVCMLTESLLILLVNRFCPWIIGKKRVKK